MNFNHLNPVLRTGLIFLVISSFWRWFVHPSSILPEDLVDGIQGLFLGISITCMLIGLVRSRRSQCSPGNV